MALTARGPMSTAGLAIIIALGGCADSEPSSTADGAPSAAAAGTLEWNSRTRVAPPTVRGTRPAAKLASSDRSLSESAEQRGEPPRFSRTDQGAADFVTWWFTRLNSGYQSGRLDDLWALSGGDCTACADYQSDLAGLVADGARTTAPPFGVADVRGANAASGVCVVTLTYTVAETTVERPGAVTEVHPGVPAVSVRAAVVWTDTGWEMGEIGW